MGLTGGDLEGFDLLVLHEQLVLSLLDVLRMPLGNVVGFMQHCFDVFELSSCAS